MQDYNIDNTGVNTEKTKKNKFTVGIIFLCLGLLIGTGATALYYSNQIKTQLNSTESDRKDLEAMLENLDDEINDLDTQVQQLSYVEDESGEVKIIETSSYSENIESVAEAVLPSVVGVRTVSIQEAASYFMGSGEYEVEGVGTGVIVSEDGLILTNQHVVSDNPKSITVTLMDGSEYDAGVIYSDEAMDLAVIKIEASGLTAAKLGDSDDVSVGQVTIAIGNPLGLEYERSVTAGIVSALDRSIQLDVYSFATNLIQTDAAINSGNSGGPLLNSSGEVIGINTYKLSTGEGMGFAVPINAALPIIEQVIETGEFKQSRIGVSFIDMNIYDQLSDEQIMQLGMDGVEFSGGLIVLDIDESSFADDSGMEINDILTHADGVEINTLLKLRTVIYSHLPGEDIELTLQRGDEVITILVELLDAGGN